MSQGWHRVCSQAFSGFEKRFLGAEWSSTFTASRKARQVLLVLDYSEL
jgi:hypothetical protein